MALQKEVWISDVQEVLTQSADFTTRMSDLSEFITNKKIHVPQAGSLSTPTKNASAFPLVPGQRVDSELVIDVDQYSTNPVLVTNIEEFQLSYNKRQSLMRAQNLSLVEFIGNSIFQKIAPTAADRKVVTTGALKYTDILKVQEMLDMDLVPAADRSLELPVSMFYELLADDDVKKQYASGLNTIQTGNFVELAGIKIYKRKTVATVDGSPAGVAYQKQYVGVGQSAIDTFLDAGTNGNGLATYGGGSIMSNVIWMGADKLRTDSIGVISLVRG